MSQPHASHDAQAAHSNDPVENIIHFVPVVLPVVGGIMMFLLAFIAVYMA